MWQYATTMQKPGELSIKDDSQQQVTIPQLEAHKAHCTLGIRLAPDRNWETVVNYLPLGTSDWKTQMAASLLSSADATFSLKHVIMRKLAYPLVTTTFLRHQYHQIMAPILQQGLPKAGVVQTFPRALAHGPLEYSSLEIPHLFTEQTIAHVHTLLQYSPVKEDPMGFLLHATGEAMHLEMGCSSKLLVAPLQLAANVTNSRLKHIWVNTQELRVNLQMILLMSLYKDRAISN